MEATINGNSIELTSSDLKAFNTCRQLWHYSSSMGLNLGPKNRAVHFAFGDLMHLALKEHYSGNNAAQYFENNANLLLKQVDPSLPGYEKIVDLVDAGPKLLASYAKWAKHVDDFEVVAQEQRHVVRLNESVPGIFFSFKFDMLIRNKRGLYLLDFKTTSQLPSDTDFLTIDDQAVSYQWAAEQIYDEPVLGIIYQYIRKKNPCVPEQLKNGQLTRRANIVTTEDVYRAEIRRLGLDEAAYEDTLRDIALSERDNFFLRTSAVANAYQRKAMGEKLLHIAEMMSDDPHIYPMPERTKCSICDFAGPCKLRQAGFSDKQLLESEYVINEPRD